MKRSSALLLLLPQLVLGAVPCLKSQYICNATRTDAQAILETRVDWQTHDGVECR